jgi:hypothetical protein
MPTARHDRERRLIHVEAPGCIVNVRYGLEDAQGRAVTSVSITPDAYAGEPKWMVVVPDTSKEPVDPRDDGSERVLEGLTVRVRSE